MYKAVGEKPFGGSFAVFLCGLGDFFGNFTKILKKEAENFEKYLAKDEKV